MRKEIDYVVTAEGRDKGKVFHIVEMPASKVEKLGARAAFLLAQAGVDLPDVNQGGMAALAYAGLQALGKVPFEEAELILDAMFSCITIKPDRNNPGVVRPLLEEDIEEVATRLTLRGEVFKLHVNFSFPGAGSISNPTSKTSASPLPNTSMSPPLSEPSFHPAKRRSSSSTRR